MTTRPHCSPSCGRSASPEPCPSPLTNAESKLAIVNAILVSMARRCPWGLARHRGYTITVLIRNWLGAPNGRWRQRLPSLALKACRIDRPRVPVRPIAAGRFWDIKYYAVFHLALKAAAYFAVGHSSECFSYIKDWVEKKVRRHLAHARKRQGFGWERWSRP
jgi:hypothetical protein